jgi:iron complex transport system ATP-binding protein
MSSPAVTATAVELGYDDTVAVAESSFSIPAGEVTAIIGPNGSGKSTVLKAIAGLIEPISGSIEVAVPPSRVAFVLQSTAVSENLPVSVREVVGMGRYPALGFYKRYTRADREAIDNAMERAGITALASRQLHTLSGGQRQRVFVAQGLAQDHDLLLLDEPFTGIDLPTARAIDDMIHQERNKSRTIVISTHDLTEARHADHVLLLAAKLVAQGPPSEVITPAHLAAAYGSSILHPEEEEIFMDDPAHRPVVDRHFH